MILSHYNFPLEYDGGYYIYNALSNALIDIDQDTYSVLSSEKNQNGEFDPAKLDGETVEALRKNSMLTTSYEDEFLIYKSIISRVRAERDTMHITIAPTMDCHFNCHYCFEKFKRPGNISEEMMDRIIKFISGKKEVKALRLTWFGGEPLMAIHEIETFYDKLKAHLSDIQFSSNIITTAYDVTEETVRILKKVQITSMQITIDGMKETHNKIKRIDGVDVFEQIIKNIELLNDEYPELHIVLRVNLTKANALEYPKLVDSIFERFKGRKNINPAPAFILEKDIHICNECNTGLFNHKERSAFILDLYHHGYDSPYARYPNKVMAECAIRNDLAVAFDPRGYVYKCWEVIGDESYAIGKIGDDGRIVEFNQLVYNRQMYGADPLEDPVCRKCRYLPICNGGCPIHRIQNKFEKCRNNYCSHYKGYLEEFLKIHIARSKRDRSDK